MELFPKLIDCLTDGQKRFSDVWERVERISWDANN